MSTTGRVMCYFLYTTLLINLISDTNGQMLDRVGPPGSQGAPGPKGEMAQKGEKGEIGLFGITAHEGSDDGQMLDRVGPPGSQGAPGPKGEMAQKGEKGEIGLFGITAHEGSDDGQMLDRVGPPGSQGAPGPKGEMAQKGEKGEIGLFGITAHEGSDDGQMLDRVGPPGSQGAPGPKGEMAQKGEKGEIGLFGITAHEGSDDGTAGPGYIGVAVGQMLDRVGPPGSQGAPGPKGEMAQKGEKGEIGLFGITAHEGSDDGQMLDRVGPPGSQGAPGPKGEMGQKGEKGEIGLFGITAHEGSDDDDDKHREPPTPVKHGSEDDPATSCQDKNLDTSLTGPSVFIYPANPFQVNCGYSVTDKTCLIKSKTKEFKGPGPYKFQKSPFWLSNAGFDLLSFYGNFQVKNISQLKYLLKISYKVSLEIIVHCKNMEISEDPKKYLQIHLWNGQNIGPFSNSKSPVYYEIPDELNKCKNFADETKWETATIKLNAPSTFIKDFYIQDIKEGKEQGIYLELTSFCLYN